MPGQITRTRAPKLAFLAAAALAVVGGVAVLSTAGGASEDPGESAVTARAATAFEDPPEARTPAPSAPGAPAPENAAAPEADPIEPPPEPAPALAPQPAPQPAPTIPKAIEPSAECAAALAAVEGAGLDLPAGTAFRCPGSTEQTEGDRQHSGVACWGNRRFCPGGSYIAVNPDATGKGAHHLQYVVAHEICHIQAYLAGALGGTEAAADECAARAGFPRP